MIRIYLDQNVITRLKAPTEGPFKALLEAIIKYRPHLVIPFSPAHISDLLRGLKRKVDNEELITKELDLISLITENQHIVQYYDKKDIYTKTMSPHSLFEARKADYLTSFADLLDFKNIFSGVVEILEGEKKAELEGIISQIESTKFSNDGVGV
jgi:5'-deoxynucleotidase YfbR-like HD superfamily hydrolase